MKSLLALLLAFLTLGADAPDEPDAGGTDPAPDGDPPDDGELPDLDGDDPDPPASGDEPDDPDAIRAELAKARERAEAAERNAREATERAAAAERARQPAAGPTDEQKQWEHEEQILRDPKSTEQQKYWVNANRTLRSNERVAKEALRTSQEMADKTEWNTLVASTPVLKKYAERVEKKLAEIRSTGSNLPRKVIAQLLIGEDIVGGKVKSTKRAAAGEGGGAQPRTVDRGKPPSGKSDVRGRAAASEHEKRRARLDGRII